MSAMSESRRRKLLKEFVRSHRRSRTREELGLPSRRLGRRHVTQDDLAQATGLDVRVIQRIEAGIGRPDASALDLMAEALGMNAGARCTLYELALGHPPAKLGYATGPEPNLDPLVDVFGAPALAVNAAFEVHHVNAYARLWFAGCERSGNWARWLLLDPHAEHVFVNWQALAHHTLAQLRDVAARFPDDDAVGELVDGLATNRTVAAMLREAPIGLHASMNEVVLLRPPGHTDPHQTENGHLVLARLLTLQSPSPGDERRVFAFADPQGGRWPDLDGAAVCDACAQ
jgi:transcriptional regulator with XRE-family HTH domain